MSVTAASVNRRFRLARRPEGRCSHADFEFCEEAVPEPADGQALVRTLYLSLDPTNRIWMSDMRSYMPPVPVGDVMRGLGLGQVVASRDAALPEGALVTGLTNWQDYVLAGAGEPIPFTPLPDGLPLDPGLLLGTLGITGITAYFGVTDIGKLQAGETMVVSAAAGAVGSIAGQIGKILDARVVGIAGTPEKCAWITDELGFDAAVCHRDADWREQLRAACPDGIDVDFENVGGEILGEILGQINLGGRVVLSGLISMYNETGPVPGPVNFEQLIMQRASIQGFVVLDYAERYAEAIEALGGWLADGRLRGRQTVVDGLESTPEALNRLFDGDNTGKLVVKVADA